MSGHVLVDGQSFPRGRVFDREFGANVPESDAQVIARVRRDRENDTRAKAYAETEAGKLDERRRKALRAITMPVVAGGRVLEPEVVLDAANIYLADFFLVPSEDAEVALAKARRPAEDARAAARAARKALPLTPTSGMQAGATLEEISAAQGRHREASARIEALEAQAVLLENTIEPELAVRARRLRDLADAAIEDRRLGRLVPPRPASAIYKWTEDDSHWLCDLFQQGGGPSDIYGPVAGIGLPSGTPTPKWRALYGLAGLPARGRRFEDDAFDAAGDVLCQDDRFLRNLANCLRAGLAARFGLDPARGAAYQKRERDNYAPTRPDLLGVVSR